MLPTRPPTRGGFTLSRLAMLRLRSWMRFTRPFPHGSPLIRLRVALSLALVTCVSSLLAQAPTFTTRRDAVRVDVLVRSGGQVVRGLSAADFEVFDDGVLQQVDLASFDEVPLNVILALDVSQSVAGDRLEHLRSAALAVLNGLKNQDHGGIVTFNHVVTVREELTREPARLKAALENVEAI